MGTATTPMRQNSHKNSFFKRSIDARVAPPTKCNGTNLAGFAGVMATPPRSPSMGDWVDRRQSVTLCLASCLTAFASMVTPIAYRVAHSMCTVRCTRQAPCDGLFWTNCKAMPNPEQIESSNGYWVSNAAPSASTTAQTRTPSMTSVWRFAEEASKNNAMSRVCHSPKESCVGFGRFDMGPGATAIRCT
jgi:hypothetical protein